jgi:hypothetical protein
LKNIKDYINSITKSDDITIHYGINGIDKADNIENFLINYSDINVDKNGDCYNSNYQIIWGMYIVKTNNYGLVY